MQKIHVQGRIEQAIETIAPTPEQGLTTWQGESLVLRINSQSGYIVLFRRGCHSQLRVQPNNAADQPRRRPRKSNVFAMLKRWRVVT